MDKPTTLYRYFDVSGRLIYVGITSFGEMRVVQHAHIALWWPMVATATYEHFQRRSEARVAELQAIKTENPLYNVAERPHYRHITSFDVRRVEPTGETLGSISTEIKLADLLRTLRRHGWPAL